MGKSTSKGTSGGTESSFRVFGAGGADVSEDEDDDDSLEEEEAPAERIPWKTGAAAPSATAPKDLLRHAYGDILQGSPLPASVPTFRAAEATKRDTQSASFPWHHSEF